ncbi:MAG: RHS repeat protein, partial [Candidatus Melainabacteria bacterium]|nr:RHS repeat protein [Candidatus Melainabacteria bacterium]
MAGHKNPDLDKAVADFKEGLQTHDFSKVMQDLQEDLQKFGPNNKQFENELTKRLHEQGILKGVDIIGLDQHGHMVLEKGKTHEQIIVDKTGHIQQGEMQDRQGRHARVGDRHAKHDDSTGHHDGHDQPPRTPETQAQRPTEHNIERDAQGNVSRIEYPANGKSQEFSRDQDGNIVKIRNEEGETWAKGKDDVWTSDTQPAKQWKGELTVDKDGNLIKTDNDGFYVENVDGSKIEYSPSGKILGTETPDGKTRSFGYDEQGRLKEINGPGAARFVTTDGGQNWTVYTESDGKEGYYGQYDVQVDKDGNISYKNHLGGRTAD